MKPFAIGLLLGFPLAAITLAIVLMVWRAFHPKGNAIRGLTNGRGEILNPYIYAAVSVVCLVCALISYWWISGFAATSSTSAGRLREQLSLWSLALTGTGLSIKFFRQYLRLKRSKTGKRH
ncbi:MAG TPA: hypothetical protein VNV60_00260 [Holophagaceae bacterium]|jgi:hypothetical protein|nr:hypothetical protein [Holophagaceae bacterium]